jgi:eukaryotic-like serine/threonine-protein kinase
VSELWSLPGYDVRSLVGDGRAGDLWSAVDVASGRAVTLRRVGSAADGPRLRSLVDLHAELPYVVRLLDVVEHDGLLVLVLEAPEGGALDAVVARRGPLDPGEVVTVGVPLAEALAAAHAHGVVHGSITGSSVLFTAAGMPLLADLGLEPSDAGPQDDVAALAELCAGLLVPGAAPALEAVLASASGPHAAVGAGELADLLRGAAFPEPVRLRPGAPVLDGGSREAAARHARRLRRPSRGAGVVLALVLLVVCGAGAGWWSGRGGEHGLVARQAVADDRWGPVLEQLYAARARAFAAADEAALAGVYAPAAPGGAADARLVRALAAAGRTAEGVRHRVTAVDVVHADADRAELRVVDSLGPYDVRDAAGTVVARRAGRAAAVQRVRLQRTDDGWRLLDVRPA